MMPNNSSIRFRLTLWSTISLAILIWIFAASVYWISKEQLLSAVDRNLMDKLSVISASMEWDDGEVDIEIGEDHKGALWKDSFVAVYDHRKSVLYKNPKRGGPFQWPIKTKVDKLVHGSRVAYQYENEKEWYRSLLYVKKEHGRTAYIMASAPLGDVLKTIGDFRSTLTVVGLLITFISSCLLWFALGFLLRPLSRMARLAKKISANDLNQRLEVVRPDDEIGQLATTLNDLFSRLEDSFNRISRFTSDASHELRTPLAGIRMNIEVALQKERSEEEYKTILADILEETLRLTSLSESLLTLTRNNQDIQKDAFLEIDLAVLLQSVYDKMKLLAEDKQKELKLIGPLQSSIVLAEQGMLEQIILNLIDNAIEYGGNEILMSLTKNEKNYEVNIRDNGSPIKSEQREIIFDRFTRLDPSRHKKGFGLGLCLSRSFAQLHGGKLILDPSDTSGNRFVLNLPKQSSAI